MNPSKLPAHVHSTISEFLLANDKAKTRAEADQQISAMHPRDALDAFLMWHGIINYTDDILEAVHGIDTACEVDDDETQDTGNTNG